jgi:hypothetical protein
MVYLAGVIYEEELDKVRSSGSYRASIWLTRFNFIPAAALVWLGPLRNAAPGPLFFLIWLLLGASIVTALVLLHRSGAPFVRSGLSWRVQDPRMTRQIFKDVFWLRRPWSGDGCNGADRHAASADYLEVPGADQVWRGAPPVADIVDEHPDVL